MRAFVVLAGCAVTIATVSVHAKTEAEAADELIAMLGVMLPCPRYAVAWLEPSSTIEYRCTPSVELAFRLREALPRERVGYIIDMQAARDRYASAYRFRRISTPAVTLAQYVAGNAVPDLPKDKLRGPASPLIVYSRATASPEVRNTEVTAGVVEAFR